jgi:dephospho-CoA kinase
MTSIPALKEKKTPLIIGLTGSIGMGKSTVAEMFINAGVPVFDADAVVHQLQGPGGELVPEIEAAFAGTTSPAGVDRQALGAQVWNNPEKLALLESIVHPAVAQARARFFEQQKASKMVVLDIPLLLEKGGVNQVDIVVVVSAPADVQRTRVLARSKMTLEKLDSILALQMPDEQKKARADYVIDTGQSLENTQIAVRDLISKLALP